MPLSLMPLEERNLFIDLNGYSPVELTMVKVDTIFAGEDALTADDMVMWTSEGSDDYEIIAPWNNAGSESGDLQWGRLMGNDCRESRSAGCRQYQIFH